MYLLMAAQEAKVIVITFPITLPAHAASRSPYTLSSN